MLPLLAMRKNRRFLILFLLLFGVMVAPAWTEGAYARVRVCRGDPIVVLTDKRVVRMTVEIAAFADEIDSVVYTLHVPRGVEAKQITYTGGELGKKERVEIIDDLVDVDAYMTTLLVQTTATSEAHSTPVNVDATFQLQNRPQSRSGLTDQLMTHTFDVTK